MSTIKLLSCSASYLVRSNLSQTHRNITSCLPTGVISLNKNFSSTRNQHITYPFNCILASKPPKSSYELTKYCSNSFSTAPHNSPDKNKSSIQDQKVSDTTNADDLIFGEASKLSNFAKFKLMYKKYWYVLIPVHVTTTIGWLVGFYYLSKSGVDIPAMLEYIHLSDSIIEKVKHSDMGHYAIAYLCYKVIVPLRYAVSLGITTISIKRLALAGYIKPIPTKKELIQMFENRAKRKKVDVKRT